MRPVQSHQEEEDQRAAGERHVHRPRDQRARRRLALCPRGKLFDALRPSPQTCQEAFAGSAEPPRRRSQPGSQGSLRKIPFRRSRPLSSVTRLRSKSRGRQTVSHATVGTSGTRAGRAKGLVATVRLQSRIGGGTSCL